MCKLAAGIGGALYWRGFRLARLLNWRDYWPIHIQIISIGFFMQLTQVEMSFGKTKDLERSHKYYIISSSMRYYSTQGLNTYPYLSFFFFDPWEKDRPLKSPAKSRNFNHIVTSNNFTLEIPKCYARCSTWKSLKWRPLYYFSVNNDLWFFERFYIKLKSKMWFIQAPLKSDSQW